MGTVLELAVALLLRGRNDSVGIAVLRNRRGRRGARSSLRVWRCAPLFATSKKNVARVFLGSRRLFEAPFLCSP